MPTAKRLRSSGAAKSKQADHKTGQDRVSRPTPAEIEEKEHPFVELARKHWLKGSKTSSKVKVKNDVLKQNIWDVLESENFQYKSLLLLESLQTLERYLWPAYTEQCSNYHVLLMVLIINVKRREHLETWSIFEDRPADFSSMFHRVLSMLLDPSLSLPVKTNLLCFLIHAFQSLDSAIVRKECAPLVAISIWHNLASDSEREILLDQTPHLRKAWRATSKRYDASDDATKAKLRFERSWLYSLLLSFISLTYQDDSGSDHAKYCERFVEFLSDLLSQLPTRRYVNSLVRDLHIIPAITLSPAYRREENALLRDLVVLLSHYTSFTIDDQTGVQFSRTEAFDRHCAVLGRLQRVALKYFKEKLTILALSNYGAIDKRGDLKSLLDPLTDDEMRQLFTHLGLKTDYPDQVKINTDRNFLNEVALSRFERRKTFQESTQGLSLLPTEQSLFDRGFQRADSYDGSHPLALPKLNLQYLSVGDFLWRTLVLYRCESFYGIRKDIEIAVRRLKPKSGQSGDTIFGGFSKMAMPITKPTILEVVPPLVGEERPSMVRAEVSFDVRRLSEGVRREWDALRTDDVVFLLTVVPAKSQDGANGTKDVDLTSPSDESGIVVVRAAEILRITDDRGRLLRDGAGFLDGRRKFTLKLDAQAYARDAQMVEEGKADIYQSVNLLLRRNRRENNFRPVLESIRSLVLSDAPLPSWLYEVFLGYGDPAGANHKNLDNQIKKLDYRDTFLDWQHLIESLPGKTVEPSEDAKGSFGPPYVLETVETAGEEIKTKASKKRRRDAESGLDSEIQKLNVSTYEQPNLGPYPTDVPRLNSVRFTPAQVEAILSGSQPGLTVIVGPPGTGKTDVATQIINNIYHSFPEQKTLLLAHSNQALNQLFAKIAALDIDERHLLRLGHGEEDLSMEGSFSKHGRVESFLQNREKYLFEVRKLATSLGAPGAHDSSAETAGYFNTVYVEPAWTRYLQVATSSESSAEEVVEAFPFHTYFSDTPEPLFAAGADKDDNIEIAEGCYRHISRVFSELADILPFEILRRERDRANYLLTREARVIAMTTTHAAIRRGEIAALGFHYDNVVMEEAAQVTEIETFLPLAMQKAVNGKSPLQRVILCGDHLQNSPVIQSLAFRHYANLEQSLFSRFVRLGVPTVNLDQQGRARPSIASLYSWRYASLGNLSVVQEKTEFRTANAGFRYDFQFVSVPDYKGQGEREPTAHFIQNLGEAEYAVAVFQYMRLLGYPADKISILTTYAGQRALVKDIISHRCANNSIFGQPKAVATVDKYQGEQSDYIILSLTRTSRVGYLRDVRRMTVAMSRARLGLYILGRREVFEACPELRPSFDILLQRPDKLMLVTGEMWPSKRILADEAEGSVTGEVAMENVEHLGQYVFEMTNSKMKQVGGQQRTGDPMETITEESLRDDEEMAPMQDRNDGGDEDEADDGTGAQNGDGESRQGDEEEEEDDEEDDDGDDIEPDIQEVREAEGVN